MKTAGTFLRPSRSKVALAAVALLVTGVAACSSASSAGGSGGSTQAAPATINLGMITDATGAYSSAFTTAEKGIKAYVTMVNSEGGINGHKLSYVVADTTSTPAGALTAAQELVQRDHVFAVIAVSSMFFGAEPYLLKEGVPVVGTGIDGNEWTDPKNSNLFDANGTIDYNSVSTAAGEFMKAHGVTVCGSIGDPNASSGPAATSVVKSCTAAGLKNGYLNTQVPPGTTDVGAIALAMQKAGVNGISLPVVVSTGFALIAALKQLGVKLKVALLYTGYGADLLSSSAAVQAGQGDMFLSQGLPVEANTAATKKMAAAFAAVGVTGSPGFAEQASYLSMAAVAAGLRAAGPNPTQKSFMTGLRAIHDFNADGLLSPGSVDFSNFSQVGGGSGAADCLFPAQLEGTKFVPVKGTPACGHKIPGLTTGG
jgi:branched-chain amino acid transport system substrate-binding protein